MIIPRTDSRGMGLLEVLAAMALLALGVTSIFGALGQAAAWNQGASVRTQAVTLAAGVIEEFKARPDMIRPMAGTPLAELGLDLEPPSGMEAAVSIREYDRELDFYLVVVEMGWSARGETGRESLAAVLGGSGL